VNSLSEYSALLSNRENLYRFFARLYRNEVDADLFEHLSTMGFPSECEDSELAEGYQMLAEYLRKPGEDPLTDLAVDYAKVFLGVGIYESEAAYPYESVYTSKEHLIMQESRDQVLAIYRTQGLDRAESLEIPEDHIALELEFMAHLCKIAIDAIAAEKWAEVATSLKEQKNFLTQHLGNWTPEFCQDILKYATTDFYKAVSKITNGFLHMDQAIITNLLGDIPAGTA
jgi:putative dimethyl sulfoxide reductase chaperone